ncbi:MAG: hypothetical protein AAB649_07265 [Patescibacteria group bacterium]
MKRILLISLLTAWFFLGNALMWWALIQVAIHWKDLTRNLS